MNKPQTLARLARDARLVQEAQLAFLRARGFDGPSHVTEAAREVLNRRWMVSGEKAALEARLARVDDLPCAAPGLISYRYRGPLGAVMIGAAHEVEALSEAARSICETPGPALLDVWNGAEYVPVSRED